MKTAVYVNPFALIFLSNDEISKYIQDRLEIKFITFQLAAVRLPIELRKYSAGESEFYSGVGAAELEFLRNTESYAVLNPLYTPIVIDEQEEWKHHLSNAVESVQYIDVPLDIVLAAAEKEPEKKVIFNITEENYTGAAQEAIKAYKELHEMITVKDAVIEELDMNEKFYVDSDPTVIH